MPNIIIKDEYGTPETFLNVNTVKFETPEGGYASFRYNEGSNYPRTGDGYRVRFIDYNGDILKVIWLDEGDTVTPPEAPIHEGLEFDGWNHTAEEMASVTRNMDIGALYSPVLNDTGTTTILHVDTSKRSTISSYQYLHWQWNGAVGSRKLNIDWGDGSTPTVSTGTNATHAYSEVGEYDIRITVTNPSGGVDYKLGSTSSGNSQFHIITEAIIATNCGLAIGAFYDCSYLTKVSLPIGLTEIPSGSFYNTAIKKLHIPSGVTPAYLNNMYLLEEVSFPANYVGEVYCAYCYRLKAIVIPRGASLRDYSLAYCYSLEIACLPTIITEIPGYTFIMCASLRDFLFPPGLISIGDRAFYSTCMTKIDLPETVTSIEQYAFYLKPDLGSNSNGSCISFTSRAEIPPTLGSYNRLLATSVATRQMYVPAGSLDAYKTAANWSTYANYMVGI